MLSKYSGHGFHCCSISMPKILCKRSAKKDHGSVCDEIVPKILVTVLVLYFFIFDCMQDAFCSVTLAAYF